MAQQRPQPILRQKRASLRRDPNAVVASAAVMTGPNRSKAAITVEEWQTKAWEHYDRFGELRAAVGWKANALSRVNLVAAIPPVSQGDEPTIINVVETPQYTRHVELVEQIAGGVAGQGQMLAAITRLLEVPGVAYVLVTADPITDAFTSWRSLSSEEVRKANGRDQATDPETGVWYDLGDSDLLIKVWRAHPRRSWQPDSPVRGVLDVLDEMYVLSQRVKADALSRLTGNGLLIAPEEAEFAPGQGNVEPGDDVDEFIETFIKVGSIAMTDRESPAATLPLVVTVPGELAAQFVHLKFHSEMTSVADDLRQAAVRRLALGLDMPPEVLLGLGDSNHWSAWQIAEEAVTLHVEPLAETICHALTTGYLKAALKAEGLDPESVIVWYDSTDLSTRPDLSAAASEAHTRIKISDDAYLAYLGLDVADKPDEEETNRRILLDVARAAPNLAPAMLAAVGILPEAAAEAAAGAPVDPDPPRPIASAEPDSGPGGERDLPERADAPPPADDPASAALLAAADGLVYYALDRVGLRLKNAATRAKLSIASADLSTFHCAVEASTLSDFDKLLDGVWGRVDMVAARHGVDPSSLAACLDGYTRGLIAAGHEHTVDRLAAALGVPGARRVVDPA